ncbi:hypothetical protein [[Acholeplasma] multilocale]|uniref:hypothetical protein n=1 Tax=[Acholeplasma] multilocale TaxID=264638 RepID=UPI000688AC6D|nr:hypothetical protein [[Acholeplasma] multilocale]
MNCRSLKSLEKKLNEIEQSIIREQESLIETNPRKNTNIEKLKISENKLKMKIDEIKNPEATIGGLKRKGRTKKKRKMWASVVILVAIVAIVILVSWILHLAKVEVTVPVTGDDGSVTNQDQVVKALGLADIFFLPLKGFERQVAIVIFIFMIGAFINIVVKSKALEGMAQNITVALKGKEIWAILPLMLFFSICGSIEGMCEESLGFYAIMIPLMLMAGFDTFTALLIVFLGAGVGVVGSTLNPFAVTTAVNQLNDWANDSQFISAGDGVVWRFATWFVLTAFAIAFTMRYAYKVKRNPQLSYVFHTKERDMKFFLSQSTEKIEMTWQRKTTLAVFALSFLLMLFYLINWDAILGITAFGDASEWIKTNLWFITGSMDGVGVGYLIEVGTFFLIGSVFLGIINGLGQEGFLADFTEGAADYIGVVFVLSAASGVSIALEESNMKYLITDAVGKSLGGIDSSIGKVLILFLIFIPISFLIPSTSGFSALIFPLIAPVVAIPTGVAGEYVADPALASGSIAAFVAANGIVNLFSPMAAALVGGLALARIDYGVFLRRIWPVLLGVLVIVITMLTLGVVVAENVSGNIA